MCATICATILSHFFHFILLHFGDRHFSTNKVCFSKTSASIVDPHFDPWKDGQNASIVMTNGAQWQALRSLVSEKRLAQDRLHSLVAQAYVLTLQTKQQRSFCFIWYVWKEHHFIPSTTVKRLPGSVLESRQASGPDLREAGHSACQNLPWSRKRHIDFVRRRWETWCPNSMRQPTSHWSACAAPAAPDHIPLVQLCTASLALIPRKWCLIEKRAGADLEAVEVAGYLERLRADWCQKRSFAQQCFIREDSEATQTVRTIRNGNPTVFRDVTVEHWQWLEWLEMTWVIRELFR